MANRLEIYGEQVRNFTQTVYKFPANRIHIFGELYPGSNTLLAKVHSMQYNRTSCACKNHFISQSIVSAKTVIKSLRTFFSYNMRCCPVKARCQIHILSLRPPYLRAGECVSRCPQIRIAPTLDTHLPATLTASVGKGIRIRQQLDTYSTETQYAFGRG